MRVLHMFTNPHLTNGATVFEYRISEFLKKDDIFFDYLVTQQADDEELARYKQAGSRLFRLPIDNSRGLLVRELKINREYYRFFKRHKNEYDIVYADTENALRAIHLFMARLAGIPVRVVHSHNTGLQTESKLSRKISRLIRYCFYFSATHYFACSDLAAEWLFPKGVYEKRKYKLLTNGVDLAEFAFDPEIRGRVRASLGIGDSDVVVGNIGRFMPQKNHKFILEIFEEILKQKPGAKLLLIGTGPLLDDIKALTKERGLSGSVVFVGNTPDVKDYLQAMDVFLMPSLFEGLPITGIEAQANGLPCVMADTITSELKITPLITYKPLDISAAEWASCTLQAAQGGRADHSGDIKKAGYSINDTVSYLKRFYLKKGRKKC